MRKDLGNAGDDIRDAGDDTYHRDDVNETNAEKKAWRDADGNESVADKVGNAGDDLRS